jgi:hypothetical protein
MEYSDISTKKYDNINKKFKEEYEFAQFIPVPGMFNSSSSRGCVAKSSSMNFNKMSGLHTYQSCQTKAGLMYSDVLNNEKKNDFNKMLGLYFKMVDGLYNGNPTYFTNAKIIKSGVINNLEELGSITSGSSIPVSIEVSGFIETPTSGSIKLDITSSDKFQMWINKNSVYDYNSQNTFININKGGNQLKSIEMFAGVGKQIRIQFQVNNLLSSNITINKPVSYYYYTTKDSQTSVNPNQMYFYLEENTKEDTQKGLFNCYINDANKIGTKGLESNKAPISEVYGIWSVINKVNEKKLLLPDNYAMIDDNGNFSLYNGSSVIKKVFINKVYDCNMQLNDDEARQYQIKYKISDYQGTYTNSTPSQSVNTNTDTDNNKVEGFKLFGRRIKLFDSKKSSSKPPPPPPPPPPVPVTIAPVTTSILGLQSQKINTVVPTVEPNVLLKSPIQPIPQPPPPKRYSDLSDYINSFWTTEGCNKGKSPINSYRIHLVSSNNNKVSIYIEQTTSNGSWVPISTIYSKSIANASVNGKWQKDLNSGKSSSFLEKNIPITKTKTLISADAKFLLKINNTGNLVLYFSRKGCFNKQSLNNKKYTYSKPDNKNYYLYNVNSNEKINRMYYVQNEVDSSNKNPNTNIESFTSNNYKNNSIQEVPMTSEILTPLNTFTYIGNYAPESDNLNAPTVSNIEQCYKMCTDASNCSMLYYMTTQNGSLCQIEKENLNNKLILDPSKINVIQPGSKILKSDLYVRNKTINLDPVMMKENIPVNQYISYKQLNKYNGYDYNSNEFNSKKMVGPQTSSEGTSFFNKQNLIVNNTPIKEGMTVDELNKKNEDLKQKAQRANAQFIDINKNHNDLKEKVKEYKEKRNNMYNNPIYEESPKYFNYGIESKDLSLLAAINEDSKDLSIQENNMLIIGSIASASLIIISIMLARK